MMYIIEANASHILDVIKLAKEFHGTSPYKSFPVVDSTVFTFLNGIVENKSGVIFLCYEDSKPVALLIGIAQNIWFGDTKIATELAWYADPDTRNKGIGKELMRAFEGWAVTNKCKIIAMMSIDDSVGKYYQRKGYTKVEAAYIKTL